MHHERWYGEYHDRSERPAADLKEMANQARIASWAPASPTWTAVMLAFRSCDLFKSSPEGRWSKSREPGSNAVTIS
jgi:hypothetical protein